MFVARLYMKIHFSGLLRFEDGVETRSRIEGQVLGMKVLRHTLAKELPHCLGGRGEGTARNQQEDHMMYLSRVYNPT